MRDEDGLRNEAESEAEVDDVEGDFETLVTGEAVGREGVEALSPEVDSEGKSRCG